MTEAQKTMSSDIPLTEDDNPPADSLLVLVRQLASQGSLLADQQLKLVRAEFRETADEIKAAVAGMLGAAVVGIAGLGVLLMGLGYLLGDAIENLAWGTIIVGVVTVVAAIILYSSGRKKLEATSAPMERSLHSLKRTATAARGDL